MTTDHSPGAEPVAGAGAAAASAAGGGAGDGGGPLNTAGGGAMAISPAPPTGGTPRCTASLPRLAVAGAASGDVGAVAAELQAHRRNTNTHTPARPQRRPDVARSTPPATGIFFDAWR